jgi:hypothetical protein
MLSVERAGVGLGVLNLNFSVIVDVWLANALNPLGDRSKFGDHPLADGLGENFEKAETDDKGDN